MHRVYAQGVIDEAPTVAFVLREAFFFLLQVGGVLVLIACVVVGLLYLFARGDQDKIALAKKGSTFVLVGTVLILSAYIIFRMIVSLLSATI